MTRYKATINPLQVHDGDTIERVVLTLIPKSLLSVGQEVTVDWPGLSMTETGLCVEFNLRISDIDTPEIHPHHHYDDGTLRTQASLDKEKSLATEARDTLVRLIERGGNEIYVSWPKEGKYARRMVAVCEVLVDGVYINVGDFLMERNLARPYEGGTKSRWA